MAGWKPTAKQQAVRDWVMTTDPGGLCLAGYGGAVGGGKTELAAQLALSYLLAYPGQRGLIGRKTLRALRTTTMQAFDAAAEPWIVDSNRSENWRDVRAPDWPKDAPSSRVYFGGVEDYLALGSEEYGFVILDEAGETSLQSALMLLSRLRHAAAPFYLFLAASNPWPGWFEEWFANGALPEEVLAEFNAHAQFFPARIQDNPHIKPSPEAYLARLRTIYPADWVERLVEGSFEVFVGQVYPELSPPMHEWRADLPPFYRFVGGLDFGGQNPWDHLTCGVVAGLHCPHFARGQVKKAGEGCAQDDWLIRFAEYGESGSDAHDGLVRWMGAVEQLLGHNKVEWRGDRSQIMGLHLLRRQFRIAPSHGGPDSVVTGIGMVRRRLRMNDRTGRPRSFYVPGLTGWYGQTRRYRWKEQPNPDARVFGEPLKRADDFPDADRYMHEQVDGWPLDPAPGRPRTISGRRRATTAV